MCMYHVKVSCVYFWMTTSVMWWIHECITPHCENIHPLHCNPQNTCRMDRKMWFSDAFRSSTPRYSDGLCLCTVYAVRSGTLSVVTVPPSPSLNINQPITALFTSVDCHLMHVDLFIAKPKQTIQSNNFYFYKYE